MLFCLLKYRPIKKSGLTFEIFLVSEITITLDALAGHQSRLFDAIYPVVPSGLAIMSFEIVSQR